MLSNSINTRNIGSNSLAKVRIIRFGVHIHTFVSIGKLLTSTDRFVCTHWNTHTQVWTVVNRNKFTRINLMLRHIQQKSLTQIKKCISAKRAKVDEPFLFCSSYMVTVDAISTIQLWMIKILLVFVQCTHPKIIRIIGSYNNRNVKKRRFING